MKGFEENVVTWSFFWRLPGAPPPPAHDMTTFAPSEGDLMSDSDNKKKTKHLLIQENIILDRIRFI